MQGAADLPVIARTHDWWDRVPALLRLAPNALVLHGREFEQPLGSPITICPPGPNGVKARSFVWDHLAKPWPLRHNEIWWLRDHLDDGMLGWTLNDGWDSVEFFVRFLDPSSLQRAREHLDALFGAPIGTIVMKEQASPRLPWYRRWFGDRSERAAERFLKAKGYKLITRNWTCGLGEVDLIARDGQTLVFVEVRSTASPTTAGPNASVDDEKQRRLSRVALAFIQKHGLGEVNARFDVLLVSWPPGQREARIEHHPSAFEVRGKFQMHG